MTKRQSSFELLYLLGLLVKRDILLTDGLTVVLDVGECELRLEGLEGTGINTQLSEAWKVSGYNIVLMDEKWEKETLTESKKGRG